VRVQHEDGLPIHGSETSVTDGKGFPEMSHTLKRRTRQPRPDIASDRVTIEATAEDPTPATQLT
jgi:hypothetical protein